MPTNLSKEELEKRYLESRELKTSDHGKWYANCLHETEWIPIRVAKSATPLTPEIRKSVVRGTIQCPSCLGYKFVSAVQLGVTTGIVRDGSEECWCAKPRACWREISAAIPERYRRTVLSSLSPSPLSKLPLDKQQGEIDFLRQHPEDSYFFLGKAGTSKTTYAIALYRGEFVKRFDSLWKDERETMSTTPNGIWRVNGDKLMKQFQEKAINTDAPDPDITPARIQAAVTKGLRPYLVLEEIDKAKMSEFRANNLFSIVDALYENDGRLVLTTNLTLSEFASMFANSGNDNIKATGTALMRRITEMCHIRSYF